MSNTNCQAVACTLWLQSKAMYSKPDTDIKHPRPRDKKTCKRITKMVTICCMVSSGITGTSCICCYLSACHSAFLASTLAANILKDACLTDCRANCMWSSWGMMMRYRCLSKVVVMSCQPKHTFICYNRACWVWNDYILILAHAAETALFCRLCPTASICVVLLFDVMICW